jgi:hypothetical protein
MSAPSKYSHLHSGGAKDAGKVSKACTTDREGFSARPARGDEILLDVEELRLNPL